MNDFGPHIITQPSQKVQIQLFDATKNVWKALVNSHRPINQLMRKNDKQGLIPINTRPDKHKQDFYDIKIFLPCVLLASLWCWMYPYFLFIFNFSQILKSFRNLLRHVWKTFLSWITTTANLWTMVVHIRTWTRNDCRKLISKQNLRIE